MFRQRGGSVAVRSAIGKCFGYEAPNDGAAKLRSGGDLRKKTKYKEGTIEAEMAAMVIDRRTMLRTGLTSRKAGMAEKAGGVVVQVRNPLFMKDRTSAGGVLYDDLDGTEMIAMVRTGMAPQRRCAVS